MKKKKKEKNVKEKLFKESYNDKCEEKEPFF